MGNFIKCFDNRFSEREQIDIERMLAESPSGTQLRFAFAQAILVSYFGWMYDIRNNPFVVKYAAWLKNYIENLERLNFGGIYQTMYMYLKALPDSWYGGRWIDLPIKEVKMFLIDTEPTEEWYPKTVMRESFLVPYLMTRNNAIQEGYATYPRSFELPIFGINFNSKRFTCSWICLGSSYMACPWEAVNKNDATMKQLSQLPNIANILIRCRFGSEYFFERILNAFRELSLDSDPYRERSSSDHLFYASYTVLSGMVRIDIASLVFGTRYVDGSTVDAQVEFDHCIGNNIMTIFHILNKTQGVMFKSRDFFVRYFGKLAKTSPQVMNVVKMVTDQSEKVASATEMLAVKNGIFSGMEAIRLFSHEDESQISSAVSAETTQETGTDEDDLDTEDIPDIEVADPGLEAEGEDQPSEEEEDTSTDSDQGEDDSSSTDSDDNQSEDPQESEEQDAQSGEETSGDDSSGSQDSTGVQSQGEAEDIDTSDDEGIEIEFSGEGGDSVDTVLFREELDQFITDTLVNPPKKLSPQSVAALTTLQRCWVHILTVETVVRILDRIVAVPDKFKQILKNQESKKHE